MVCVVAWWECEEAAENRQRKQQGGRARGLKKRQIYISKSTSTYTQLVRIIIHICMIDDANLEYLHLDGQWRNK
jgi:hypothetical protein